MNKSALREIWIMDGHKPGWMSGRFAGDDWNYLDDLHMFWWEAEHYWRTTAQNKGHRRYGIAMREMLEDSDARAARMAWIKRRMAYLWAEVKDARTAAEEFEGIDEPRMRMMLWAGMVRENAREATGLEKELEWLNQPASTGLTSWDHLDPRDIERAREHPIEEYLGRGKGARVPCPWHEGKDRNVVLKGFAFCFVCNVRKSALDWAMEIDGMSFADAVRRLR